jgi:hypothetical protein
MALIGSLVVTAHAENGGAGAKKSDVARRNDCSDGVLSFNRVQQAQGRDFGRCRSCTQSQGGSPAHG